MRRTNFQMCIQCRKLQKCLLMQAQTPSPPRTAVSPVFPQHLCTSQQMCMSTTVFCVIAPKSTHTQPCNQIQIHFTWLPFKNIKSTLHTYAHTHTDLSHVCSGQMPKWESMHRQDQSPSGSVSIYVCAWVIFRQEKHQLAIKSLTVLSHLFGLIFKGILTPALWLTI